MSHMAISSVVLPAAATTVLDVTRVAILGINFGQLADFPGTHRRFDVAVIIKYKLLVSRFLRRVGREADGRYSGDSKHANHASTK